MLLMELAMVYKEESNHYKIVLGRYLRSLPNSEEIIKLYEKENIEQQGNVEWLASRKRKGY